ncbi:hypothetical protein [Streptomyces sp. NPDC086519]
MRGIGFDGRDELPEPGAKTRSQISLGRVVEQFVGTPAQNLRAG